MQTAPRTSAPAAATTATPALRCGSASAAQEAGEAGSPFDLADDGDASRMVSRGKDMPLWRGLDSRATVIRCGRSVRRNVMRSLSRARAAALSDGLARGLFP